jgi:hypothetical protein
MFGPVCFSRVMQSYGTIAALFFWATFQLELIFLDGMMLGCVGSRQSMLVYSDEFSGTSLMLGYE